MKSHIFLFTWSMCLLLHMSCKQAAASPTDGQGAQIEKSQADLIKIKAEIQALNDTWANAVNAKDVSTIVNFYAEDAISMPANQPLLIGKAAIQKDAEAMMSKRKEGSVTTFETMEIYGDVNRVTEIGKTTTKDASGKVAYTDKYMVIWQKQDGKWRTIRDIYNDDVKE